jgi:hypothetical protein
MLVHQGLGLVGRTPFCNRDQTLARRHDAAHRLVKIGFETRIAIGDNAHYFAVFDHRQTGNAVVAS